VRRTVAWSSWRSRRSARPRCTTAGLVVLLACVAPQAWAQSEAANLESRAILEVARAVGQADARARDLRQRADGVLRNLQRSNASARGVVSGWTRAVGELRAEAATLRERRAALRIEALTAEQDRRAAAPALRTYRDLNARLARLEDAIARAARSIEDVQARLKDPEPPPASPAPAAERPASPRAAESPRTDRVTPDLSGMWRRGNRRWTVEQQPGGAVVLRKDHVPPDGNFDEYRGTINGLTVTLTHRVTPLTDYQSNTTPARVRQEAAGRGLTLTYSLTLSPDGRRLEGVFDQFTISWDRQSQQITRITPKSDKVVLTRVPADSAVFLPEPTASVGRSAATPRGVLTSPDRAATVRAPSRADPDANGTWTTQTGKVALMQVRSQVRGLGIRFADGCRHEFEGQATRAEGGTVVLRLRNSSTDPGCYKNLPATIAATVIGTLSNEFELTLDPEGHALRGQSVHDRVEFDSATNRILSVRKDDRWNVRWQRKAQACSDTRQAVGTTPESETASPEPASTLTPREIQERITNMRRWIAEREATIIREGVESAVDTFREHEAGLRDALLAEYQRALNASPSEDVRVEAEFVASRMIFEWHQRRRQGWEGVAGWWDLQENLQQIAADAIGEVANRLGSRSNFETLYGICANWQEAFSDAFFALRPRPRHFGMTRIRANANDRLDEHNAVAIGPRNAARAGTGIGMAATLDDAILIDPYRVSGRWFHGRLQDDKANYPWDYSRGGQAP